jgi:hypothetical protein
MKRLITDNHVILLCSSLYSLISILPDAMPQQIFGSKPVLWVLTTPGIA